MIRNNDQGRKESLIGCPYWEILREIVPHRQSLKEKSLRKLSLWKDLKNTYDPCCNIATVFWVFLWQRTHSRHNSTSVYMVDKHYLIVAYYRIGNGFLVVSSQDDNKLLFYRIAMSLREWSICIVLNPRITILWWIWKFKLFTKKDQWKKWVAR